MTHALPIARFAANVVLIWLVAAAAVAQTAPGTASGTLKVAGKTRDARGGSVG